MNYSQTSLCLTLVVLTLTASVSSDVITARCDVEVNSAADVTDQVTGEVFLQQSESGGPTTIVISLSGFDTSDANVLHGFHIHVDGDLSNGCQSTSGHYNPFNVNHGAPTSSVRHVGDLGNIEEDSQGRVETFIIDDVVSLIGEYSVLGRAIVVHAKEDDLGLGGDQGSITTGNAGARLACCVITEI